ncbi:T9SS type A sorting domain-containing protein [Hymenobacter sp. M29]|uniref:T9SS type A sorting domain-containing protein n=1 Tax=Hymenobacter mellowenesis TaxID=3063995 RepID=A0ABT9AHY0_9BACT|nr:T9SS type A sorting domain-containing protein [Hymenobacter sp. M29]MDO7848929.1 T9SS type A sorting domain-containing protein [Hymenobacter sp. M29]
MPGFFYLRCRWHGLVLMAMLLAGPLIGAAQVPYGPVLDPAFQSPTLRRPAIARGALQLSDGARIVVGDIDYADGQASSGLVRYLPTGLPDAGFNARVQANTWQVESVREVAGNKLLVQFADTARVSGQPCASLVRLLPNGRRDSTFTSPPAPFAPIKALLVLADGRVLLGLPTGLARLQADGMADTAFSRQYGGAFGGDEVSALAQQADGRVLVGGNFDQVQGTLRPGLARLQLSGALDASYLPDLAPGSWCRELIVQPTDGRLLCAHLTATNYSRTLARLLPATGALDASFQLDATVSLSSFIGTTKWPRVQAQANGAILLAGMHTAGGSQQSFLIRISAAGTYDPTWLVPLLGSAAQEAQSVQVLPTGQVLAAAGAAKLFATGTPAAPVAVLDAAGAYAPAWQPALQTAGYVSSVAVQADGKILIAGGFSEVNGTALAALARLLPNGRLDASYRAGCALFPLLDAVPGANGFVEPRLALQPDGKLLVSGLTDDPASYAGVLRLLPSGCPDATFSAGLRLGVVQGLSLQPDGRVLLTGIVQPAGTYSVTLGARLTATGAFDAAYQLGTNVPASVQSQLIAQPDSTALLLNTSSVGAALTRHLATGAFDPSFLAVSLRQVTGAPRAQAYGVVRDATGRQLVFGELGGAGTVASGGVVRVLANGSPDPTFQAALIAGATTVVTAVAEQPNGRLLVGSGVPYSLQRLLPDGQLDGTFDFTQGPSDGQVRNIIVQPDGAILVAGTFRRVGQQARAGLIRLLAPGVLAVGSRQPQPATAVFPVPAHDRLYLRLDALARPQSVALLDALGRPVLRQPVVQSEMSLPTASLAPGIYLLRIEYATSTVTRRVVLE